MKYWPASFMLSSPFLRGDQKLEISNPRLTGFSHETMVACKTICNQIPACTSLALMYTEGVGRRRVFLQMPTQRDWLTLERTGFVALADDFGFVEDALH